MPATGVLTAYADVPAWPTGASEGSGWTLVGEIFYRLAGAYLLPPDEKRKVGNGGRREMVPAGALHYFYGDALKPDEPDMRLDRRTDRRTERDRRVIIQTRISPK